MPVLPDRERRHLLQFYVAPKMGYRTRLALGVGLVLAGILAQCVWPGDSIGLLLVFTLPFLLCGNIFLLVQGYDLTPGHSTRRNGEWQKTTRDRFAEARKLEDRVKGWDETIVDITCVTGFVSLLALIALLAFAVFMLSVSLGNDSWALIFVADAAVLILPHWITGTRRGWRPAVLRQELNALETALSVIDRKKEPPCQVQPMFEMVGKGDNQTPIGARVFVRFPEAPEDFLGIQFQVAINNVQGTKYPYLYAVLVAKKSFGLLGEPLTEVRDLLKKSKQKATGFLGLLGLDDTGSLTVERSSEAEVDVIVVRQRTTKKSGYHTDAAAIHHLTTAVWQATAHILRGVAVP